MKETTLNINLVDKLVLLALDDEKGTFVSNALVFGYCIAGAVLFELSVKKRIEFADNKISVLEKENVNDEVLDYCLDLIADAKKERKISYWVQRIGNKVAVLRKMVLSKLIGLGILEEREDKVLWIFTSKKYPTKNELPENLVRKRLHDIVTNNVKPELDEVMMISLVDSCDLNKEVYGKELAKEKRKLIKSIPKNYEFADDTSKLIKELHDAVITILVILIASSTVNTVNSN